MCSGDMTLEWAMEVPEERKPFTVDGWGIEHRCRNWDNAFRWTVDHRAPEEASGTR